MRFFSPTAVAGLVVCASSALAAPAPNSVAPEVARNLLASLPLRFEPRGTSGATWLVRGQGFAAYFDRTATILRAGGPHSAGKIIRLTLDGSNPDAQLEGTQKFTAGTNYFIGKDFHSVSNYARLRRVGVYEGIDMVFYGRGQNLEYDFEIGPGADPGKIRMRFDGVDAVRLNQKHEIELVVPGGSITQQPPTVYQRRESGEVIAVDAAYRIEEDGTVSVNLGAYDRSARLVIDPVISLQAYLGGSGGRRQSRGGARFPGVSLPGRLHPIRPTSSAGRRFLPLALIGRQCQAALPNGACWLDEAESLRARPQRHLIVYSTFFGGSLAQTLTAMTVDPATGIMYFVGTTNSPDFPLANAFSTTLSGITNTCVTSATNYTTDFFSVLDPSQGSESSALLYSTFFGGTSVESPTAIAFSNGLAYITGYTESMDFPVVAGFQPNVAGGFDAFLSVFDITQSGTSTQIYSTYFGGSEDDLGRTVAVDSAGLVYIAGGSFSPDLPTTPFGFRPFDSGAGDGFLAQIDINANVALYVTYFGGTGSDEIKKILIDPTGLVAMTGYTVSTDFPLTLGGAQLQQGGNGNAFLALLNVTTTNFTQALKYSTYYGGTGGEVAYDMRRDPSTGRYVLVGYHFVETICLWASTERRELLPAHRQFQCERDGGGDRSNGVGFGGNYFRELHRRQPGWISDRLRSRSRRHGQHLRDRSDHRELVPQRSSAAAEHQYQRFPAGLPSVGTSERSRQSRHKTLREKSFLNFQNVPARLSISRPVARR